MNRAPWLTDWDSRWLNFMERHGTRYLRISLGIVFIWFGILKVLGRSPVGDLVAKMFSVLPSDIVVPLVGWMEIVVGIGLLFRIGLRVTLIVFWLELIGTLGVFVILPWRAFQNQENPLLLTMEGEFILKNLVLITAGLVVAGTIPRKNNRAPRKE